MDYMMNYNTATQPKISMDSTIVFFYIAILKNGFRYGFEDDMLMCSSSNYPEWRISMFEDKWIKRYII